MLTQLLLAIIGVIEYLIFVLLGSLLHHLAGGSLMPPISVTKKETIIILYYILDICQMQTKALSIYRPANIV
jgi:hypothetical protein